MHRAHLWSKRHRQLPDDAREDLAHPAQREGSLRGDAKSLQCHPLSFPGDREKLDPGVPGGHGRDRRGGDHGGEAQGASDLGRAVSSREHPDGEWPADLEIGRAHV